MLGTSEKILVILSWAFRLSEKVKPWWKKNNIDRTHCGGDVGNSISEYNKEIKNAFDFS